MIRLLKDLIKYIRGLFISAVKVIIEPEILYFDTYIRFKKAPLIGKVYRNGAKMWRVVHIEKDGRFKCQLLQLT